MEALSAYACAAAGFLGSCCTARWELICSDARFRTAAAILEGKLYLVGGCRGDYYLNDVMVLNLEDLKWSTAPAFPVSCSGHTVIARESTLVALVAVPSDDFLRVYEFDGNNWLYVITRGACPVARRGHSSSLIGNKLWVFGGEDVYGEMSNETHILDLEIRNWERVTTCGPCPPPRSFHGAALHNDQLYVLGGCVASSLRHLYVLDTKTRHWSEYRDVITVPGAFFSTATIGEECYIVGGVSGTTLLFNLETMTSRVIAVDSRLSCHSRGLCLLATKVKEEDVVIACGNNVLMMKTMHFYRPVRKSKKCEVLEEDGSIVAVFNVPDRGKPVARMLEALGRNGRLLKGDTVLTGDDLVRPREVVTFQAFGNVTRDQTNFNICFMDGEACRHFLSRMKIKIARGEGWLEASREIPGEAYSWKTTTAPWYMLEFLKRHGLPTMHMLDYDWYEEAQVEEISSSDPDLPYELTYQVRGVVARHTTAGGLFAFGIWMEEDLLQDSGFWKALVALLALNIQSHSLKPWMVISDLKDEWHFAWMDGNHMFVCRACNRSEALGMLIDLSEDYNKATSNELPGLPTNISRIFSRRAVGLKCDTSNLEVKPVLFQRRGVGGGTLLSFGNMSFVVPDEDEE